MTVVDDTEGKPPTGSVERSSAGSHGDGLLGRLGTAAARRFRLTLVLWLAVLAGLGVLAPKAMTDLAGAGWQADGSQSVQVRQLAEQHFGGTSSTALQVVVHSDGKQVTDPAVQAVAAKATALLNADHRIADVVQPQPGATVSRDGHTEVLLAGSKTDPDNMVRAADDLKKPLAALSGDGVTVTATGASVLWSDFNAANHSAMLHSEIMSWPVTMVILVIAFGSIVAAGLPLLLTVSGLAASAGALVLLNHLTPVSIWAMNFAMMFALALGIDYALFLVVRFRAALARHGNPRQAVAETMDTAGKAVALSGATVLVSLSAVMLVPVPAFRSMAAGIMLAVTFVLAATLTLLPAVLGRLGHKIDSGRLPWAKKATEIESEEAAGSPMFAGWGEKLWRHPLRYGLPALAVLLALAAPLLGLRTSMPSITVVPKDASARVGYTQVQQAFSPGMPGTLQIIAPTAQADTVRATAAATPGIAAVTPATPAPDGSGLAMIQAVPTVDPSDKALGTTVDRLRADLPHEAKVGGAAVENLDLQHALNAKTPLVLGAVL
ncbi:MMPL family transporter, partial [Catenulispora subtropica]|uniref:MMPL family transporter n=1 Tax=Catenulispora subtropica TaxID=450798 RepID=UPI0031DF3D65